MEGFMRKIYNFINGLEVLHLIGTYEKVEEEEEEIYEVINVHKLKSATPNLRVINLYGINFIDDSHIDAFSSNCIQVMNQRRNEIIGHWMKSIFLLSVGMLGRELLQQSHRINIENVDCTIETFDMFADERH